MNILGISAFFHDSAAAIIIDGRIVSAAQEERFTRIKHDSHFPIQSIQSCLKVAGLLPSDIDAIVFYEKPFLKFERILQNYLATAPKGFRSFLKAMPLWLKDKLFQKTVMAQELIQIGFSKDIERKIFFSDHHLSHAASAFYPSPFENAAILTMDGVGEWATTSIYQGHGNSITPLFEINYPHSLGMLYSAFTAFTGFKVNSGEYKLMGLAPYGQPIFEQVIMENLIDLKNDGSFRLNMDYFGYLSDLVMFNTKFETLFAVKARKPEDQILQIHMDLAASIQKVLETVVLKIFKHVRTTTGLENICLAGGVALNCVANGKALKEKIFNNIWVQPAAGDAGGAIGAALAYYHIGHGAKRVVNKEDGMSGAFLGPELTDQQIDEYLKKVGANYKKCTVDELFELVTDDLANSKAVGWFQGKMEFGPRALGGRSILADARSEKMQTDLNLKVKFRESFRPFAPSVLEETASQWFDLDVKSPYMLLVAEIHIDHRLKIPEIQKRLFGIDLLKVPRSKIPAVTHVDYSARVQTVSKRTNEKYHQLLTRFNQKTGSPVLVNTSFNVRGEPIVCTAEDAFRCFMGTDIETLAIGSFYLQKKDQDKSLIQNYVNAFELD